MSELLDLQRPAESPAAVVNQPGAEPSTIPEKVCLEEAATSSAFLLLP